jgi:plasmid stabilization system protein ParE
MRLRFTPRAAEDIAAIADYLDVNSPAGAQHVRAAILQSLQSLLLFPNSDRVQAEDGVRKLITRKYPYLIYYTVDEVAEEIAILTIQHAAREREHGDA